MSCSRLLCRLSNKFPSLPLLGRWTCFANRGGGVCCQGNLRILSKEDKNSSKNKNIYIKKKKIQVHLSVFPHITCASPPTVSCVALPHSHSTLFKYLHSYLFTFLFKIYAYKCVYKLKIISSFPVAKWHLQGKGCVGLRFLFALQEPMKRQHRTLWTDEVCGAVCLSWVHSDVCFYLPVRQRKIWPAILVPMRVRERMASA